MMSRDYDEFSDQDLERIERLIDAATQGPWFSYVVGRNADVESNCIEVGSCNELGSFQSMQLVGGTSADQDFIASARQDLPRLVTEVRRLRACLESLRDPEIGMRVQSLRPGPDESASLFSA